MVETGPETDWGHKSGEGRELRLALTLWDRGERPVRLRALTRAAEAALESIEGDAEGWQIVSLHFLRERAVPPRTRAERAYRVGGGISGAAARALRFRRRARGWTWRP